MSRCNTPCSAHVPAAKFAHRFRHQTAKDCTQMLLHRGMLLYRDAFTHGGFCTEMLFTKTSFYIHMYAHTDAFARGACTHKNTFTQRCFYTVVFLHGGTFTRRYAGTSTHSCFYTGMLFHRNVFTHMCFYTGILLTQSSVYTQKLLHAYTLAQRCFYTDIYTFTQRCFLHRCVYTEAFLHRYFCTEMLLHKVGPSHRDGFHTEILFDKGMLLDTVALTHRCFQHIDAFTCRCFKTQFLTQR